AEAASARHLELDVAPMVDAYVGAVSGALGRKLRWRGAGLRPPNIQARARGPGVWLIANLEGKLLLATSNRSEAAVGYATMDGDTCGGLPPPGGLQQASPR